MLSAITPIDDYGVLHISGSDAVDFLHRQLSNDFALLGHDAARLATLLTPKGRMLASFIGVRHGPTDVLLLTHRSVLAATLKRLSMYVLRAQVHISDASGHWHLRGLLGQAALARAAALPLWGDAPSPAQVLAPWQTIANAAARAGQGQDAAWLIGLYPAHDTPRALLLADAHAAPALPPPDADARLWAWSEVAAGIATISQGVAEQFVPQMLNYESVGGISFKKGCYPGQEVVARSQFRGAVKRRAYLAQGQATALPAPGTEVWAASQAQQACGLLVQAAWLPEDPASAAATTRFAAIVSIQTAHAHEPLHLRPEGQPPIALELAPAPYPILEDL